VWRKSSSPSAIVGMECQKLQTIVCTQTTRTAGTVLDWSPPFLSFGFVSQVLKEESFSIVGRQRLHVAENYRSPRFQDTILSSIFWAARRRLWRMARLYRAVPAIFKLSARDDLIPQFAKCATELCHCSNRDSTRSDIQTERRPWLEPGFGGTSR